MAIAFDLQKALPCPLLTTNKIYYMRQLWTYNFCVHNLATNKATMFLWNESIASRGSQEVASCLNMFLKYHPNAKHLIAYSDCCGGQNRNKNIAKFWMYVVKEGILETIDHKFLEPGHTYMECDRDFGVIEKRKKKTEYVFVPDEWANAISNASKSFTVVKMQQSDFISTDAMNAIVDIKPSTCRDTSGHPLKWSSIRWMRFEKRRPLVMLVKPTFNHDYEFLEIDFQKPLKGRPPTIKLDRLYQEPLEIKEAKWKNLQELLPFIPPVYHEFYTSLTHDGKAKKGTAARRGKGRGRGRGLGSRPEKERPPMNSDYDSCSSTLETDSE